MNDQRFNLLFSDKQFNKYVGTMFLAIYNQNKKTFQDNAIDYEDFTQDCWMSLFECVEDDASNNYCYTALKNKAIDILRSMKKGLHFTELRAGVL